MARKRAVVRKRRRERKYAVGRNYSESLFELGRSLGVLEFFD